MVYKPLLLCFHTRLLKRQCQIARPKSVCESHDSVISGDEKIIDNFSIVRRCYKHVTVTCMKTFVVFSNMGHHFIKRYNPDHLRICPIFLLASPCKFHPILDIQGNSLKQFHWIHKIKQETSKSCFPPLIHRKIKLSCSGWN